MSVNKKHVNIGLLWHSVSSDNLGVGALTESQISLCESAALKAGVTVSYVIFGTVGGKNYLPSDLNVQLGSRVSIKQIILGNSKYIEELSECDFILDIGEGDSFSDIYGFKRFIFLIVSKIAVLRKRKPLILSPQTIGPFNNWFARFIAISVMKKSQRIFARDGLSYDYLIKTKLVNNSSESIDVAFKLPFLKHERQNNKINIGLNVSGLLFSGGYTKNNQFQLTLNYPKLIRDLLDSWSQDDRYKVWLIPHVIPDNLPVEDDRKAIDILINEYESINRAPDFNSPSEAKTFISSMDFVTGARMHACIAAFSSGVPVVPLAYSRKFNGLFNSLSYKWIADGKLHNNKEAFKIINDGLDNRDELKVAVEKGNDHANQLLDKYENFLVTCMK